MKNEQGKPDLSTVGGRIAWAREQRGLSQGALAKASGISQTAIANYETGSRQPRDLLAIAWALEAAPAWLRDHKGSWQDKRPPVSIAEAVDCFDAAVQKLSPQALEELRDVLTPYLKSPARYQRYTEDVARILSGERPTGQMGGNQRTGTQ